MELKHVLLKHLNYAPLVAHTFAIQLQQSVFQKLFTQYAKLYKRNAFCHWYTSEGMDSMRFQDSYTNIRDLISEYQDKQDITLDSMQNTDGDSDEDGYEDINIDDWKMDGS